MVNILHGVDWRKKNMGLNTEAGLLRQPLSWGHPPCKEQPLEGVTPTGHIPGKLFAKASPTRAPVALIRPPSGLIRSRIII